MVLKKVADTIGKFDARTGKSPASRLLARMPPLATASRCDHQGTVDGVAAPLDVGK
jgi:hypothetical protein